MQFFQPTTIEEAAALLSTHGPSARPLAGGTDLVVHARIGRAALPDTIVDLGRIPALDAIFVDGQGVLHLGARATHQMICDHPLVRERWTALAEASALVGSPATRHMGTIGGNLVNGSPAMETGGPLLAFDASVRLVSTRGQHLVALGDFLRGPGQTARAADEVLAEVLVPPLPGAAAGTRAASCYLRLGFRRAMEIAIVGVSAVLVRDQRGTIADCRLALTAVAPVIIRVPEAEQAMVGQAGSEARFGAAGALARAACSPIDDVRAPAAYRREMVGVHAVRALRQTWDRCGPTAAQ
jgi:CO/xanthine dehydrogenase FAD-binding subunit